MKASNILHCHWGRCACIRIYYEGLVIYYIVIKASKWQSLLRIATKCQGARGICKVIYDLAYRLSRLHNPPIRPRSSHILSTLLMTQWPILRYSQQASLRHLGCRWESRLTVYQIIHHSNIVSVIKWRTWTLQCYAFLCFQNKRHRGQ